MNSLSGDRVERWLLIILTGLGLIGLVFFCLLGYVVLRPGAAPGLPRPTAHPTQPGQPPAPTATEDSPFWPPGFLRTVIPLPDIFADPTPAPPLPEAWISGVTGSAQISTLDCEARSAVDWAAFFGAGIDEVAFLEALPKSDNPESGFVGVYWGEQGHLPPEPYGVHAPPVAALLREYGVRAYAGKHLAWADLQREIAAGRPVIAWVVGHVTTGGTASLYTARDGQTVKVVPFEHTVIVIGYDGQTVTVVDGDAVYTRGIDTFLASWAVLNNMAITAREISAR